MKTNEFLILAAAAGVGYLALTKKEEIEEITSDLAGSVPGIQIINEALQPLSESAGVTFEVIMEAAQAIPELPAAAAEAAAATVEAAAEAAADMIPETITVDLPQLKTPEVVLFPETTKRYEEIVGGIFGAVEDVINLPADIYEFGYDIGFPIGVELMDNVRRSLGISAGVAQPLSTGIIPIAASLATGGIMPLVASGLASAVGAAVTPKKRKTTKIVRIPAPTTAYVPTPIITPTIQAREEPIGFMDLTRLVYG